MTLAGNFNFNYLLMKGAFLFSLLFIAKLITNLTKSPSVTLNYFT